MPKKDLVSNQPGTSPAIPGNLGSLDIKEVTGHSLEASVRDEVNEMLAKGWIMLHIYTLKYREDNVWRERPMAILGLPGKAKRRKKATPSR